MDTNPSSAEHPENEEKVKYFNGSPSKYTNR